MARILMCPPRYYGIEYEINPWMSTKRPADSALARHQWEALRRLLADTCGAEIVLQEPVPQLPDLDSPTYAHDSWVGRIGGTKYLCVGGPSIEPILENADTQCYDLDARPASWEPVKTM